MRTKNRLSKHRLHGFSVMTFETLRDIIRGIKLLLPVAVEDISEIINKNLKSLQTNSLKDF